MHLINECDIDQKAFFKENEIRNEQRFVAIRSTMSTPRICPWFEQFIQERVIEQFVKMGLSHTFASLLFRKSAPSWETMGRVYLESERLYPRMDRRIAEVRKGVIANSDCCGINNMSWITLPRTYLTVNKDQSICLPCYIKHLKKEQDEHFLHILKKVTTEFVANYSLRFVHRTNERDKMLEVLFFGFAAVFWRVMHKQQHEFEQLGMAMITYKWLSKLVKRESLGTVEMETEFVRIKKVYRQYYHTDTLDLRAIGSGLHLVK